MTKTNQKNSLILQTLVVIVMLTAFIGSVAPLFLLPFVNVLPYLQSLQFLDRLLWSLLLWALTGILWFIAASPNQRRSVRMMIRGWKDALGVVLGIMIFIFSAAGFSANTFGSLVKILPGDPYASRFEVTAVETGGAKYKSVTLDLKSMQEGKEYYLTLSKRLFDYPRFQVGDELLLTGKKNVFGVYVENFKILHS